LGIGLADEWPPQELAGVLRRQARASADAERFGVWVMIECASSSVVGDVGFHGPPDAGGAIELGYAVIPSRRRRGYAVEAAGALVAWGARQPGVDSIVAGCGARNTPSIRTLERVGFRRTDERSAQVRWRYGGVVGA
jgi:RimJ/RimL family protein N-acetyltransferase